MVNLGSRGQPGLNPRRIQIAQAFHHAQQTGSGQVKTRPSIGLLGRSRQTLQVDFGCPIGIAAVVSPQHPLMRPHPESTLLGTACVLLYARQWITHRGKQLDHTRRPHGIG